MKKLIRWTEAENAAVVTDYKAYEAGEVGGKDLSRMYQGRSVAAIREKARIISGLERHTPRRNPVYAAIERRMVALGYGPEVIKSIIFPNKCSIPASTIRTIENYMRTSTTGKAWFYFSTDTKGNLTAEPLRESDGALTLGTPVVRI